MKKLEADACPGQAPPGLVTNDSGGTCNGQSGRISAGHKKANVCIIGED